ncbi:MAG TPA: hypothetical protein VMN36_00940 [Verrucomicrobiales bacterium]|nr:hypothetical protein [Verrucomicrobiales bacterium]
MRVYPTVKVNRVNGARQDDYYRRELAPTSRPGFLGLTVQTYNAQGQPVGSPETGEGYVPRATETLSYDFDGNLLGDGRWLYGWDAEDRLVSMETDGDPAAGGVRNPCGAEREIALLLRLDGAAALFMYRTGGCAQRSWTGRRRKPTCGGWTSRGV